MVNDGKSGFLSDVGDIRKLAADMLRILKDAALAREMGEAGREQAMRKYGSKSVAQATIDAYWAAAQKL